MKQLFLGNIFLLLFVFGVTTSNGHQEILSTEPVLQIETGAHINKISKISADATGTYLVTASEDKTARVWEISTGKLLNVLRAPIGKDNDGMLFAAAISPDSSIIAVGGFTGSNNEKNFSIYIFDRESGKIIRRISGLPQVITKLAYSPDGKYLGVMTGEVSLKLYETTNYTLLGEDKSYGQRSEYFDFDPTGKSIVSSSFDGFVRLYAIKNNELRLVKKQIIAAEGHIPVGVSYSPDGSSIAIGFLDSVKLKVVSANDLSVLYSPDVSKVTNGMLPLTAWSADGRTLYAAGMVGNRYGINPICYWTNNGRDYSETAASTSSVFDIQSLKTGGLVFGAAGPPVWGVLDTTGQRTKMVTSMSADFRGLQNFTVNDDTTYFQFAYGRDGTIPASFSLRERKLENGESKISGLKPPQIQSKKLNITGWKQAGLFTTLNGEKLPLLSDERSFSLAILPDENSFVLGTGWFFRLFKKDGTQVWQKPTPAIPWSLNISKNGKITIAALNDGTVRWYRTSDAEELLAFFSPNDKSGRWIIWTPSGYYDASLDAEDLIGWHVNNGRDTAADFFPNHLFRSQFYRPDIIDLVLQTTDETLAVKLANEKGHRQETQLSIAKVLPPVIETNLSRIKEVSATTVKLNYKIRNHSGEPITRIQVVLDGQEIPKASLEQSKIVNNAFELVVQIPKKDSELTLIAENKFTKSLPVKTYFKWHN